MFLKGRDFYNSESYKLLNPRVIFRFYSSYMRRTGSSISILLKCAIKKNSLNIPSSHNMPHMISFILQDFVTIFKSVLFLFRIEFFIAHCISLHSFHFSPQILLKILILSLCSPYYTSIIDNTFHA